MINLLDFDPAALAAFFAERGEKPFRARQALRWIHRRLADRVDAMTDLARVTRDALARDAEIRVPAIVGDTVASDGTRKWLLDVGGANAIEAVYIPEDDRGTLCISSQAGCALDCAFCSTGKQGFNRNLSVGEIIGQLWHANRILLADGVNTPWVEHGRHPITNVVMMGMGEPLYNFDAVRDALLIVADNEGIGISRRRITLSTSGVVPNIIRTGEEIGVMLAVSLHAVRDELRNELVPLNRKYPIAELLQACRDYPGSSNARRITFEYVMLKGVNDSLDDAKLLVKLLKGIPAKINLIPFNPWPGTRYECSDWDRIEKFSEYIFNAGYSSPVRTPRGRDILAACGQLKSETEKLSARERQALRAMAMTD